MPASVWLSTMVTTTVVDSGPSVVRTAKSTAGVMAATTALTAGGDTEPTRAMVCMAMVAT